MKPGEPYLPDNTKETSVFATSECAPRNRRLDHSASETQPTFLHRDPHSIHVHVGGSDVLYESFLFLCSSVSDALIWCSLNSCVTVDEISCSSVADEDVCNGWAVCSPFEVEKKWKWKKNTFNIVIIYLLLIWIANICAVILSLPRTRSASGVKWSTVVIYIYMSVVEKKIWIVL